MHLIRVERGKMLKPKPYNSAKKIVEAQVIVAMQKQGNVLLNYMDQLAMYNL